MHDEILHKLIEFFAPENDPAGGDRQWNLTLCDLLTVRIMDTIHIKTTYPDFGDLSEQDLYNTIYEVFPYQGSAATVANWIWNNLQFEEITES